MDEDTQIHHTQFQSPGQKTSGLTKEKLVLTEEKIQSGEHLHGVVWLCVGGVDCLIQRLLLCGPERVVILVGKATRSFVATCYKEVRRTYYKEVKRTP